MVNVDIHYRDEAKRVQRLEPGRICAIYQICSPQICKYTKYIGYFRPGKSDTDGTSQEPGSDHSRLLHDSIALNPNGSRQPGPRSQRGGHPRPCGLMSSSLFPRP